MRKLIATLMLLIVAQAAWAIDLQSAKDQGLVGEANTGYLAAVSGAPSAEVAALIAEVNRKRKAEFEATAAKTDATLDQVRVRFYQLAVERTAPGHYYQDASGGWRRK
jgi:uncharacterized protein YdbL (DUF1318 family)